MDANILNQLRKKSLGIGILEDSLSVCVMNAATIWRIDRRPRAAKLKDSLLSEETKARASEFANLKPSPNELKIDEIRAEGRGGITAKLVGPDGEAMLDWAYVDIAARLYGDVSFHMPASGTLSPWDKAVIVMSCGEAVAAIGVLTRRP